MFFCFFPTIGAGVVEVGPPPQPPPTQDEGAQVRLQAPELIGVILQLFLCDPPGVTVGVVVQALLVQPL